ncbi:hypothetical protein P153DRAFT_435072 [Dothidotthia symphoricarpi CBS 119687]|uniref:Uncharacterized protein n=1 Tax=Dothidotthia symphoricarpi CBS 119687 TaxID=1392245 RepID=A0A6A6A121_9PLEO|nr:uncharacterized protein P153DRAFT_435072 [Dothidotthia symphoricarpi CBS 119687]KAF2124863.1 hypothetical protein P153DRAFT_435072 [Dothidotthia symphoricarpi CBS 119687]
MATFLPPPRTPSPKVRIRSHSFDSPSSRLSVTPTEESKSTTAILTRRHSSRDVVLDTHPAAMIPLRTQISNESLSSTSTTSSPTNINTITNDPRPKTPRSSTPPSPSPSPSPTDPPSPFLYQDTSNAGYSPWLVRVVLDLYDVRGLAWTLIAEPVERIWGVRTSSGEVFGILLGNGRVGGRRWWD